MAEHEAQKKQQMAQHGQLNEQQILHKHFIEQQKAQSQVALCIW